MITRGTAITVQIEASAVALVVLLTVSGQELHPSSLSLLAFNFRAGEYSRAFINTILEHDSGTSFIVSLGQKIAAYISKVLLLLICAIQSHNRCALLCSQGWLHIRFHCN